MSKIENKITINVRDTSMGGPILAEISDTSNGIRLEMANTDRIITLSLDDWIKVMAGIKTMGILRDEDSGH